MDRTDLLRDRGWAPAFGDVASKNRLEAEREGVGVAIPIISAIRGAVGKFFFTGIGAELYRFRRVPGDPIGWITGFAGTAPTAAARPSQLSGGLPLSSMERNTE
jgi:hypothetical protein